jgi:hypothetical protein
MTGDVLRQRRAAEVLVGGGAPASSASNCSEPIAIAIGSPIADHIE